MPRPSFASSFLGVSPRPWLIALLLVVAPVAVYWNVLHTPFVLDDGPSITENASIRSLWPLSGPLSPPVGGLPICARPVANLSLALNYAVGGENPFGYHIFNLALHILAALVLFGVLRRTLAQPAMPEKFREPATWLALAIATIWAVHPLQTAAVSYISQRTELLAALFYLLTLYAFIRAVEAPTRAKVWGLVAVIACLLGMASKEMMVSAPLIVLLYDRTFLAGTFAGAWRQRGRLHAALMATWVLLIWLVVHSGGRGGTAGFGVGVTPLAYLVTQGEAIMGYLARSVYPYPLVFDYNDYITPMSAGALLDVALIGGLAVTMLVAVRAKPVVGFAGMVFFAVLAPTSSVVPVATQTIADHRMYLPLAVVLTALALGAYASAGKRAAWVAIAAAIAAGALTVERNRDYATPMTLWQDTVSKRPDNSRAHNNLAAALLEAHDTKAGLAELAEALRIRPDHPDVLRNLAQAELDAGQTASALAHVERAQQIDPSVAAGWSLLGVARLRSGQQAPAAEAFQKALQLRPDLASAQLGLGDVKMAQQDYAGAAMAYAQVRKLRPDSVEATYWLGVAMFQAGQAEGALGFFAEVRQKQPDHPGLHMNYGGALLDAGKPAEALKEFDAALAQEPTRPELLHLRSLTLLELGRKEEAAAAVRTTLKIAPAYEPAVELARKLQMTEGR